MEEGPAAHGFGVDQRWTLAWASDLIARMFRVRYTLRGTANVTYRLGWSVQVPKHHALERDEAAIATWRKEREADDGRRSQRGGSAVPREDGRMRAEEAIGAVASAATEVGVPAHDATVVRIGENGVVLLPSDGVLASATRASALRTGS